MGMKPIASRSMGWCVQPVEIYGTPGKCIHVYSEPSNDSTGYLECDLPDGLTFAQFLDQYNRCTEAIYFID